jgi:hypothetical protein
MLADELAADASLPQLYSGLDKILTKIRAAQKFNLATDFALAADGLVDNFEELERIAPFCRLPYPVCWFEFAQADRHHWRDAPLHYPGLQGSPHRVGFLTEAIGGDLAHWRTYLCWSLKNALPDGPSGNVSPICAMYNTNNPIITDLGDCVEFDGAPFELGLPDDLVETYINTLGRSDWAGEVRYLISILGLLNARNVAVTETVQYAKLNKQRVSKGKHPLASHTLLKIRATHKPSLVNHHYKETERSSEIRAHFVRGHFKTRRSGIFWWGPHMRGQAKYGSVVKDYEIT